MLKSRVFQEIIRLADGYLLIYRLELSILFLAVVTILDIVNPMNEVTMEEEIQESGLTLLDVLRMLKRRLIGILICTFVGILAGIGYLALFSSTTYNASSSIYVFYNGSNASTSDVNYGRLAPKTFCDALNGDVNIWKLIKDKAEENNLTAESPIQVPTYSQIGNSIKATYDSNLQSLQFKVRYSSEDRSLVVPMLNATLDVLEDLTQAGEDGEKNVFNSFTISTLDQVSDYSVYATSTSKSKVLLVATALGIVVGLAYALIAELTSQNINNKKDLEEVSQLNIIGTIPYYGENLSDGERK